MSLRQVMVPPSVEQLRPFVEAGLLGPTEVHTVAAFVRLAGAPVPAEVQLAAALAVRAPLHGHVCVDLGTVRELVATVPDEPPVAVDLTDAPSSPEAGPDEPAEAEARQQLLDALEWPDPSTWLEQVVGSPLVEVVGSNIESEVLLPLVVDRGLLYLSRFWVLERVVAADLRRRSRPAVQQAAVGSAAIDGATGVRRARLDAAMEVARAATVDLFPDEADGDNSQREAALAALSSDFVVVAGGPGTGKTHTVARLLAALLTGVEALPESERSEVRIRLAAPTGKASARMAEAVRQAIEPSTGAVPLPVSDAVRERLGDLEASTIHRLLGRGRSSGFRHGPDNPLDLDVLVVDEVSMVSLSLIAHLLAAVPEGAKVVLVGDPYQLASVEAGSVLGDIVGVAVAGGAEPPPPASIAASVRRLGVPRRFAEGSGIKALADLVRRCDADGVVELLGSGSFSDVELVEPGSPRESEVAADVRSLADEVVSSARAAVGLEGQEQEERIAGVLRRMLDLKVLSALRRGNAGVDGWNQRVEQHLRRTGHRRHGEWYTGRPVMVTANDYLNRVFNGDVGVAVRTGSGDLARYQVWFPEPGGLHVVEATRLDRVATQWAMSIHKSQGSEFRHVVVTLPPPPSRILTRELLYTAVTRAKEQVTIVASEAAVRAAVERPVARASGLAARLADD